MEVFGVGSSKQSIMASACLAAISLFYIYTVGSFLQIRIYSLIDRVTHYSNFNFYLVNKYTDHLILISLLILWLAVSTRKSRISYAVIGISAILLTTIVISHYSLMLDDMALVTFPIIITILIHDLCRGIKILNKQNFRLVVNYMVLISIFLGIINLGFALSPILFSSKMLLPANSYAYKIFLLFSSFSPMLLLLLLTSFPIKLMINFVLKSSHKMKESVIIPDQIIEDNVSIRQKIAYLSLISLLSIVLVIIPHVPTINKDGRLVGVDTRDYANWMNELKNSKDIQNFLNHAFVLQSKGDRPISLILIFGLQQVMTFGSNNSSNSMMMIEYLPFLLGPLLIFAVYFLMRELVRSDVISLFAAFLTAISFQVLIGIYAGFDANCFALIFGYFSFMFLFRYLKDQRRKDLSLYGIFLMLTLFSHVYTWSIFAIVIGLLLGIFMIFSTSSRRNIGIVKTTKKAMILLFLVLLSTIAVDVGRSILISSSAGIEKDLKLGSTFAGPAQFFLRWNNLTYGVTTYLGGIFANFLILGLGLYWLYKSNLAEMHTIFIFVFLSVGVLPFLFGDWEIQTRVFYDIPFQIPAALALFYVRKAYGMTRLIPILIWLIAVSITIVSNFYFVLPAIKQP